MPKVSFVSKGKKVSFAAKPKRKRPDSALTSYQRFVRAYYKSHPAKGVAGSRANMKAAAAAWRSKKSKK